MHPSSRRSGISNGKESCHRFNTDDAALGDMKTSEFLVSFAQAVSKITDKNFNECALRFATGDNSWV
jgi:hypothetical protein